MVHLTRLELAHPKALPPQGSVYTNFTTGAYVYYNIFFHYGAKNLKIIPIARGVIFLEFFFLLQWRDFWNFLSKNRDLKTFYVLRSTIFESLLYRPINNIIKTIFTRDQVLVRREGTHVFIHKIWQAGLIKRNRRYLIEPDFEEFTIFGVAQ